MAGADVNCTTDNWTLPKYHHLLSHISLWTLEPKDTLFYLQDLDLVFLLLSDTQEGLQSSYL